MQPACEMYSALHVHAADADCILQLQDSTSR